MNQQNELLSEFETIEKQKSPAHLIICILFLAPIVVLALNYYTPNSEFEIGDIYSEPSDLIFLSAFIIFPLTILFLFAMRKKIGWIILTFYCVILTGLTLASVLNVFIKTDAILNINLYLFINYSIISILLFLNNIREIFYLNKKTFRNSLIISFAVSIATFLIIIISIWNS